MVQLLKRHAALALVLAASASCTVHKAETPAVSGPSTLALSLNLNAIPDSISQDGGSQSAVKITAIGPNGRGMPSLPLRIDMRVNGVPQDYGTLSARTVVTNSDGIASLVYTAPPSPAGGVFGLCGSLVGTCVDIIATPTGSNFDTATSQSVSIRLVPPGVILPPASTPTAAFIVTPSTVSANLPITFDASSSQPGTGSSQISTYSWAFGDGATATGKVVTHTYTSGNNFSVTLTVTNDRGLSASSTQQLGVGAGALPTPVFTVSPAQPAVNEPVFFNASTSTPGAGHSTITSYRWTFGDGQNGSGQTVSHSFAAAGSYLVQLTVTDEAGQSTTSTGTTVPVGGAPAPTANFTFSPSSPAVGDAVIFDYRTSTLVPGQPIVGLDWNFGDGSAPVHCPGDAACAPDGITTHTFQRAGALTVTLVITDSLGRKGTTSKPVTITGTGGVGTTSAAFSFSPLTPSALQPVFFNASGSSASTGHTLTTYDWNFGDGTLVSGPTFSATHTFASAGSFTITLTVTDDTGKQGRVSTPVVVAAAGAGSLSVDFSISPTDPRSGQLVTFNANLSSPVASITSYDWDFGDGVVVNGQSGFLISHTYFTATGNEFTIRLTVHDNTGRVATTTKALTVIAGQDPVASFTVSQSPTTVGAMVTFDGALSTALGVKTIVRYTWDYGDGSAIVSTTAPTTATTHSYATTGTYVIRLTVTDSAGLTGSTTRTLLVQ